MYNECYEIVEQNIKALPEQGLVNIRELGYKIMTWEMVHITISPEKSIHL